MAIYHPELGVTLEDPFADPRCTLRIESEVFELEGRLRVEGQVERAPLSREDQKELLAPLVRVGGGKETGPLDGVQGGRAGELERLLEQVVDHEDLSFELVVDHGWRSENWPVEGAAASHGKAM